MTDENQRIMDEFNGYLQSKVRMWNKMVQDGSLTVKQEEKS